MNKPDVLQRIRLGSSHRPSGKTRHLQGSELLPTPSELRIVKYPGDSGFYLFYCDDTGAEFTDTYHDTLEGALAQAQWEFEVKKNDWEVWLP